VPMKIAQEQLGHASGASRAPQQVPL
jgi:hypothetical protein